MPRTVRRLASLLVLAAVIEYLVLPQVAGARHSVHLLLHANLFLALLGVGLEIAALLAYSVLTESLLPRHRVRYGRINRINLATLAVSHVVPAGAAAGGTLGYRMLTASGVEGPEAGFALALQSIGSAVVLNVILWVSLVVSIPLYGFNPLYVTAAVLGVLLLGFVGAIAALMTRGEERAVSILRAAARRIPRVSEDQIEGLFRRLAQRLDELGRDPGVLRKAVVWAAANWLLDAASLWVFLLAFGRAANPDGLLVAYGLANVLAAVPVTPGGLGVVEGVLVPALVGFGTGRAVAILGVLSWRLVNFWLPIPAGGIAYLSLRLGEDSAGPGARPEPPPPPAVAP